MPAKGMVVSSSLDRSLGSSTDLPTLATTPRAYHKIHHNKKVNLIKQKYDYNNRFLKTVHTSNKPTGTSPIASNFRTCSIAFGVKD